MQAGAVTPRPAATLILVRDGAAAPEFLLLKRSASARFMPNAHVFPGGALDPEDSSAAAYALCAGLDDAAASRMLGVPEHGLAYYVAAIRETFEECALLLAYGCGGGALAQDEIAKLSGNPGETSFAVACAARGWRLAVDRLLYFAHWITPLSMPRRFDTRFFLAQAPEQQAAALVSAEMQELEWLGARAALKRHVSGELLLMSPTIALLTEMAAFPDVGALVCHAQGARIIETVIPD